MSEEALHNPLDDIGKEEVAEDKTLSEPVETVSEEVTPKADKAPEKEEPEILLSAKFKSEEERDKAYKELEKQFHGSRQFLSKFRRISQEWVNPESGQPFDDDTLLGFAEDAMIKTFGKPERPPEKEEPPAEDEDIDPVIKKKLDAADKRLRDQEKKIDEIEKTQRTKTHEERLSKAQAEVEKEAKKLQDKFKISPVMAYRCIRFSGANETPEDLARELVGMVKQGVEAHVSVKTTSQSRRVESGGTPAYTGAKEIKFRPDKEGKAISPLDAWIEDEKHQKE